MNSSEGVRIHPYGPIEHNRELMLGIFLVFIDCVHAVAVQFYGTDFLPIDYYLGGRGISYRAHHHVHLPRTELIDYLARRFLELQVFRFLLPSSIRVYHIAFMVARVDIDVAS